MLNKSFPIPRLGSQKPPLYNPRVNYGSNGSSGKKSEKKIIYLERKVSEKKSTWQSLVKNWCCCQLLMLMKFHALAKNESFRKWAQ